jgi:hypothetical protein
VAGRTGEIAATPMSSASKNAMGSRTMDVYLLPDRTCRGHAPGIGLRTQENQNSLQEAWPFLRSLFRDPNSLFQRFNSLFGLKKFLFVCAGNSRVSARKYEVNSAANLRRHPEFEKIPC